MQILQFAMFLTCRMQQKDSGLDMSLFEFEKQNGNYVASRCALCAYTILIRMWYNYHPVLSSKDVELAGHDDANHSNTSSAGRGSRR